MEEQIKLYLDPDHERELDPDVWHLEQTLKNVTIEILKNKKGEYSIGWKRQWNTEDITEKENNNE